MKVQVEVPMKEGIGRWMPAGTSNKSAVETYKLAEKWIGKNKWGVNVVTLEIDTKAGTCIVVER
jgi:hypothetical protein